MSVKEPSKKIAHFVIQRIKKQISSRRHSTLVDAYCHIQDGSPPQNVPAQLERLIVCGTRPKDWPVVASLYERFPHQVIPAFGFHPWFVQDSNIVDSMKALERQLLDIPIAFVGEIGLDGKARNPQGITYCPQTQLAMLNSQLDMALKHRRPVILHLVHSWGPFHNLLLKRYKDRQKKSCYTQHMLIHSYTGSPALVSALTSKRTLGDSRWLKIYFGFSTHVSMRSLKYKARLRAIPADRLLLETASGCQSTLLNRLEIGTKEISDCRGLSIDETNQLLHSNFHEFIK